MQQNPPPETDPPQQNSPPPPPPDDLPGEQDVQQEDIASESHEPNICQRYLNNKCPHGMNGNKVINGEKCKDRHPRRCYRYCTFGTKRRIGCQKGNACPKFHPKLCNNSLRTSSCYNENCKYTHLKSTKREQDERVPSNHRPRSRSRDNCTENGRGIGLRTRPPTPGHHQQNRSRFNSTASQQQRPEIPPSGYQNNSSEVYFYVPLRSDRSSRKGGGTILYIQKNIPFSKEYSYDDTICQGTFCVLQAISTIIMNIYRPPSASLKSFSNLLEHAQKFLN